MNSELASRFAFVPVVLGFACFGCALINPPSSSVIVLDEQGNPIEGADAVYDYWNAGKPSNRKGRLAIWPVNTRVVKEGYEDYPLDVERGEWRKEITMIRLREEESPGPPTPPLYPIGPRTEGTNPPDATTSVD